MSKTWIKAKYLPPTAPAPIPKPLTLLQKEIRRVKHILFFIVPSSLLLFCAYSLFVKIFTVFSQQLIFNWSIILLPLPTFTAF